MSAHRTTLRGKRTCPECGQASDEASFPFCSSRCKAVDLHRWLTGAYAIPGPSEEDAGGDDPERQGFER